jgi:hypothetical protein
MINKPQVAGRTNAKILGSATPIQHRAEKRRAKQGYQGNTLNFFTIMQNVPNRFLDQIAADWNLVLGEDEGRTEDMFDILKAKEIAQADMARKERIKEQMKEILVEKVDSESNSEILGDHAKLVEELNQVSDNPVLEVGIWKL